MLNGADLNGKLLIIEQATAKNYKISIFPICHCSSDSAALGQHVRAYHQQQQQQPHSPAIQQQQQQQQQCEPIRIVVDHVDQQRKGE